MPETNTVQATTPAVATPPVAQAATETTQPVTATTEQATKPNEMTLEAALKELKVARAEAAKYRTTAKQTEKAKADSEAQALVDQGKFKELYEKSQADLKVQAEENAKLKRGELQRKVAERLKVPTKLASRIQGETEAEMEADARDILTGLPAAIVGNDADKGGNGKGAPQNIGGFTPEQAAQWLGVRKEHIH